MSEKSCNFAGKLKINIHMRIFVFDTETSGLDPQWNVILQLSYQIVETDSWSTLKTVNHYFPWPEDKMRVSPGAIIVNGLTEEVLAEKQLSDRKTALEEFVKDRDTCDLLVAHNLEFDKKFIIAACREENVKYASSGWAKSYDTMKRTTSFCQIPKAWGGGYKWPKLTELADCLFVGYSDIPLHDSAGDVELTKRCFEGIVANGLYRIPKESGIIMILHVESPNDIHFEISKDGEPIDELFLTGIYGVTKKQLNIARQDLIKKWSEENEEERNELIQIYHKSPKLKTKEDFQEEIESMKPNLYVRNAFEEQPPSKEKIKEELEAEAKNNVSSWRFWALNKMRKEYVDTRLDSRYQQNVDEYNLRLSQHNKLEDKTEAEYNFQSQKACDEQKQHLKALSMGKTDAIEKEMLSVPDVMSLSFPYHVVAHLDGTTINIELLLPQPKDLPQMEGVRLASGNFKIRGISDKNKKNDYTDWVYGLAIYVAAHYFNVSPAIDTVNIVGHVKTAESMDLSLYNISFVRTTFETLNLEEMDVDAALTQFNTKNKLAKDALDQLFVTKEKESEQEETHKLNESFWDTHDVLLRDAVRFVVKKQQLSISDLQREYAIGYQRAGSIMGQLEDLGIISPQNGTVQWKVLVDEQRLGEIINVNV